MTNKRPFFTICVPTYNRAHLLETFFNSITQQRFQDIEVVIVDDGSTDNTAKQIKAIQQNTSLNIHYIHQPNGGRARALNTGIQHAAGEMFFIMDDDDQLTPNALEIMHKTWLAIPEKTRNQFCGIAGTCLDTEGHILGSPPPTSPLDSDFFTAAHTLGLTGDKKEVVRTDLIKDFRYHIYGGERRVPTSALWFKLAQNYQARFVETPFAIKDYLPGGMTDNLERLRLTSANSSRTYYADLLYMFPNMERRFLKKYMILFSKYAHASGWSAFKILNHLPNTSLAFYACIRGYASYRRDMHHFKLQKRSHC